MPPARPQGRPSGPLMALTTKQEAFCVAVAKGDMTASAAYRAAYNAEGMSPKTVNEKACRLLAQDKIGTRIAELRLPALLENRVTVSETMHQLGCVLRSDPRRLFRADGSMIPVHELDTETALAIASVEVVEEFEGKGEDRKLSGYTKKIKFWDKNSAIEKAMKHLGQFEKDNAQQRESLAIQVNLVGAERAAAPASAVTVEANTKRAESLEADAAELRKRAADLERHATECEAAADTLDGGAA